MATLHTSGAHALVELRDGDGGTVTVDVAYEDYVGIVLQPMAEGDSLAQVRIEAAEGGVYLVAHLEDSAFHSNSPTRWLGSFPSVVARVFTASMSGCDSRAVHCLMVPGGGCPRVGSRVGAGGLPCWAFARRLG
jgi:hypothetical protein